MKKRIEKIGQSIIKFLAELVQTSWTIFLAKGLPFMGKVKNQWLTFTPRQKAISLVASVGLVLYLCSQTLSGNSEFAFGQWDKPKEIQPNTINIVRLGQKNLRIPLYKGWKVLDYEKKYRKAQIAELKGPDGFISFFVNSTDPYSKNPITVERMHSKFTKNIKGLLKGIKIETSNKYQTRHEKDMLYSRAFLNGTEYALITVDTGGTFRMIQVFAGFEKGKGKNVWTVLKNVYLNDPKLGWNFSYRMRTIRDYQVAQTFMSPFTDAGGRTSYLLIDAKKLTAPPTFQDRKSKKKVRLSQILYYYNLKYYYPKSFERKN